ncbi:type 1 glutamine amidotransferase domain-containing protein [Luteimonas suaedae]|uniref:type 1 glutamine amidotransferase domain-containing protein n=1 Tax=Luteimonas suaedae TaxID=2605430 RepID=UPI0011EE5ADC|nr:type 1 glutamine amidotransferase domain-containing protein [Luteimonas suaedae]
MWKKLCITTGAVLGLLLLLSVAGWSYVHSLKLDNEPLADPAIQASELDFMAHRVSAARGRVLAVVSSTARFPDGGRKAGYELTELSRAYWVFVANGYQVDIASPRGGEPPMVKDDDEELVEADHAFLNDPVVQGKLAATLPLAQIDPSRYRAVYFVGGKGAMFDFPGNPDIARIVRDIYPRGAVGAVCHGPAALLDIPSAVGGRLLHGRRVTGFTNAEELFLIEDARERFPFLLQDALSAQGARFIEAPMYLDNAVTDGRLVTGQNPWSTWSVAEAMVRVLGHAPIPRETTAEEYSVRLLATYHRRGLAAALAEKRTLPRSDKRLLLLHAVVAAMQWRPVDAYRLQRLARA